MNFCENSEHHYIPSFQWLSFFQAYRLEPLIYDYYSEVPPVRLSQVGYKEQGTPSPTKSTGSWLRGFFVSKPSTSKTDVIEFKKSESEVELPKNEAEKTEEVLKDKKSEDFSKHFLYSPSHSLCFFAVC